MWPGGGASAGVSDNGGGVDVWSMVTSSNFSVRSELQRQRSPGRRRYYLNSFTPGYECASHGSASEAAHGRQLEGLLVKLRVGLLAAWFDNHWSSASNGENSATSLRPIPQARTSGFTSGFRNTTIGSNNHVDGKPRRGWAAGPYQVLSRRVQPSSPSSASFAN